MGILLVCGGVDIEKGRGLTYQLEHTRDRESPLDKDAALMPVRVTAGFGVYWRYLSFTSW